MPDEDFGAFEYPVRGTAREAAADRLSVVALASALVSTEKPVGFDAAALGAAAFGASRLDEMVGAVISVPSALATRLMGLLSLRAAVSS